VEQRCAIKMFMSSNTRFFKGLAVLLTAFVLAAHRLIAADDLADIKSEVTKRHDEAVNAQVLRAFGLELIHFVQE
jgi:hypothetical protein